MPDFTSALYLGLHHESSELGPWPQLTLGVPAVLGEPPGAAEAARGLAALMGFEDALLAPSTLHASWDLFVLLARPGLPSRRVAIYMDAALYPTMRWGVERAYASGVPVVRTAHYDPEALRRSVRAGAGTGRRPVVAVDGYCPDCGRLAPLAVYATIAAEYGGSIVVDDTQALGIFGTRDLRDGSPYGRGGGGSAPYAGLAGAPVVVVASLAKAFGAPVAVLAGTAPLVDRFRLASDTRLHCSPPSAAAVRAAAHALRTNHFRGDALRVALAARVSHFRRRLAEIGFAATGGLFPVQTLVPAAGLDVVTVRRRLADAGVRAVPRATRHRGTPRLTFIVTARHDPAQLDQAVDALADATRRAPPLRSREVTHATVRTPVRSLRVDQH